MRDVPYLPENVDEGGKEKVQHRETDLSPSELIARRHEARLMAVYSFCLSIDVTRAAARSGVWDTIMTQLEIARATLVDPRL